MHCCVSVAALVRLTRHDISFPFLFLCRVSLFTFSLSLLHTCFTLESFVGLCDGPIPPPEESYRLWLCDCV
jgi:hypothetical protein